MRQEQASCVQGTCEANVARVSEQVPGNCRRGSQRGLQGSVGQNLIGHGERLTQAGGQGNLALCLQKLPVHRDSCLDKGGESLSSQGSQKKGLSTLIPQKPFQRAWEQVHRPSACWGHDCPHSHPGRLMVSALLDRGGSQAQTLIGLGQETRPTCMAKPGLARSLKTLHHTSHPISKQVVAADQGSDCLCIGRRVFLLSPPRETDYLG